MFYKRCECDKARWKSCDHPWSEQFKFRGKRKRIATGAASLRAAQVEARRKRSEIEQEAGPVAASGVSLAVLEELHVQNLKSKGYDKVRIDTVENLWRNNEKHLGEHRDVMTLTASDIEALEGARRTDGARGQTIRRERQALRRGLLLAKRDGLITRLPFDWDDLDQIESDPPLLEQEGKNRQEAEIKKVLGHLSQKARTAGYVRMLWLIRRTGLRLEEFRRCSDAWIRPAPRRSRADKLLAIPADAAKTSKPRVVPLKKADAATVRDLWPKFATKKFNHALKLASIAAGVSPVLTPRDLRATYLTSIKDPRAAQKLGGHENIATTGLYIDLDERRSIEAGARAIGATGRSHTNKRKEKKASNSRTRP